MPQPDPASPSPNSRIKRLMVVWFVGSLVTGFLGMALAVGAMFAQAPAWIMFVAFFAPATVFNLAYAAIFIPKAVRYAREAARNAPSPESTAAVAAGEGVEAGTTPKPILDDERGDFPTVEVVDTKPGKVLLHSLPRAGIPPGCQLGCVAIFAVLWNSIVSTFVFQAINDWNRGQVQWGGVLFLSPFVLIGLALIAVTLYLLLTVFVSLLVGRVEVEVSDHPIAIGGTSRIQLAQFGVVPLARVKVMLVCTEEATYVAGTSQSTAKRDVESKVISHPDEDPSGGALPLAAEFTVPPDAMHSFTAPNNKINWTIRVTGRVLGLLPFSNDFSVTVSPG